MSEQNYANVQQQEELMKYISDNMKIPVLGAGGGFAPIGFYGWSADYVTGAPQGWLRCEGGVYEIADYPELATFYASQHGASNYWGGDGITTFAVPDLRGEFPRGAGTNSHANQGNGGAVGEHQDGTDFFNMLQWTESGSSASGSIVTYYSANDTGVINLGNRDATSTPATTNGKQVSFTGSKSDQNPAVKSFTSRPTNTSGAFFVKATVSDAEINAFNVYTPREHQVGWWEEEIDGVWKRKPVYEKRLVYNTPTTGSTSITVGTVENTDTRFIHDGFYINNNGDFATVGASLDLTAVGRNISETTYASYTAFNPNGEIMVYFGSTTASLKTIVIVRYTKTTDQWQTS